MRLLTSPMFVCACANIVVTPAVRAPDAPETVQHYFTEALCDAPWAEQRPFLAKALGVGGDELEGALLKGASDGNRSPASLRVRAILLDGQPVCRIPGTLRSEGVPVAGVSCVSVGCALCGSACGLWVEARDLSLFFRDAVTAEKEDACRGPVSEALAVCTPAASDAPALDLDAERHPSAGSTGLEQFLRKRLEEYAARVAAERDAAIQACLSAQYAIAEGKMLAARREAGALLQRLQQTHQGVEQSGNGEEEEDDASSVASTSSSSSGTSSSSSSSSETDTDTDLAGLSVLSLPQVAAHSSRASPATQGDEGWWEVGMFPEREDSGSLSVSTPTPVPPAPLSASSWSGQGLQIRAPPPAVPPFAPDPSVHLLGTSLPIPIPSRPSASRGVPMGRVTQPAPSVGPPGPRLTVSALFNDSINLAASMTLSAMETFKPHYADED